jgi:replicative DNA helicase
MKNKALLPPQALDIERSLLGALLIESKAIEQIETNIIPECFYDPKHQAIYSAIATLYEVGRPIDLLTVAQQLKATNELQKVGGAHYINGLTHDVGSTANIDFWAKIVYEKYVLRQAIIKAQEVVQRAYQDETDPFDLLSESIQQLESLEQGINVADIRHVKDIATETLHEIHESMSNNERGVSMGVPTCSNEINRLTGGFIPGGLSVIAGMPGSGKTAMLLQSTLNQLQQGYKVGIISLEMKGTLLVKRLLSNITRINGYQFRDGDLSTSQFQEATKAVELLCSQNLYVTDDVYTDLNRMRATFRKMKAAGCNVVYVDYLQLIRHNLRNKSTVEINEDITRTIQRYAREFDLPIVLLSQLARQHGKKPNMESLRGGGIEQATDLIIILWDEEPSEEPQPESDLWAIIAKAKHGSTGDVKVHFNKAYQTFEDGWKGALLNYKPLDTSDTSKDKSDIF